MNENDVEVYEPPGDEHPQNFPPGVEPENADDPIWSPDLDEPEQVDDEPPAEYPMPPGDYLSAPDNTDASERKENDK